MISVFQREEGNRLMIMRLENYKWAKANAFIHICYLDSGTMGRVE